MYIKTKFLSLNQARRVRQRSFFGISILGQRRILEKGLRLIVSVVLLNSSISSLLGGRESILFRRGNLIYVVSDCFAPLAMTQYYSMLNDQMLCCMPKPRHCSIIIIYYFGRCQMIIDIKVKLKTKESNFVKIEDLITEQEYYVAHLKSPPVDGKANHELISLVSDYFHIKKSLIK